MPVTFVLPTGEEDNWVRTGRGFEALRFYKDYKKGKAKMKTINLGEVQVHDDADIELFLKTLVQSTNNDKVQFIISMAEGHFAGLQGLKTDAIKGKLKVLNDSFRDNLIANVQLSQWLEAATDANLYPLPDGKHETDNEAIKRWPFHGGGLVDVALVIGGFMYRTSNGTAITKFHPLVHIRHQTTHSIEDSITT